MKRITHEEIEKCVERIKKLTGKETLHTEFAAVYGGWRLINIDPKTGAHDGYVFGLSSCAPRMNSREFFQLLSGIEIGLTNKSEL